MSALEQLKHKVMLLDEHQAERLLVLLSMEEHRHDPAPERRASARSMLGYARRLRAKPRCTADWMNELREGERA